MRCLSAARMYIYNMYDRRVAFFLFRAAVGGNPSRILQNQPNVMQMRRGKHLTLEVSPCRVGGYV